MMESRNFARLTHPMGGLMSLKLGLETCLEPSGRGWGEGGYFVLKDTGWHLWGLNRTRASLMYSACRTFCHMVQSSYQRHDKKAGRGI